MVFIVPPKVHLLDLSGPAQVFYEAQKAGAPLEVSFVSASTRAQSDSSLDLFFTQLQSIEDLHVCPEDFVFVPGSADMLKVIQNNKPFLSYLQKWYNTGVNLCSICVGIFWLAEAGLLAGKKSTTHWRYLDLLEKRYPETTVLKNKLFVIDENLYMSAGVSSGIDLSLHLVEQLFGYSLALEISKEIVYFFRRGGGDPQLSNFLRYRDHLDRSVHKIQDYIMNNLNTKFTLDDIADEVHMSKRNLSRKFKETTQITVGEYINTIRVERARHLLSKGHKMEQVAQECGLKSPNQLRALLKKYQAAS